MLTQLKEDSPQEIDMLYVLDNTIKSIMICMES